MQVSECYEPTLRFASRQRILKCPFAEAKTAQESLGSGDVRLHRSAEASWSYRVCGVPTEPQERYSRFSSGRGRELIGSCRKVARKRAVMDSFRVLTRTALFILRCQLERHRATLRNRFASNTEGTRVRCR